MLRCTAAPRRDGTAGLERNASEIGEMGRWGVCVNIWAETGVVRVTCLRIRNGAAGLFTAGLCTAGLFMAGLFTAGLFSEMRAPMHFFPHCTLGSPYVRSLSSTHGILRIYVTLP